MDFFAIETSKISPLIATVAIWLKSYCNEVKVIDEKVFFSFNDVRMSLSVDAFTNTIRIEAEVFCANKCEAEEGFYSGCELANVMNRNMYPYAFFWEELDSSITACKTFAIKIYKGLDFIIKVEIYRMFYLSQQIEKVNYMSRISDFPDDKSWMRFLLSVVDKWVAGDLLDINIIYLHGFASSGNSGTAKEIQECLPKCKVFSPDLPIDPGAALSGIHNAVSTHDINLAIGTSMGGLLALFSNCRNKIVVNPSFHVSEMMKSRLGELSSVAIPYYKARENGETEFMLTDGIASRFQNLEENVFKQSRLDFDRVLGVFGTDDNVVDCKDEFLRHSLNVRYFKGGHRLSKEAIEEVIIPSILQIGINEKMK